ncbi:hypothetical protein Apa02nite_020080 [Actinoplanes palleronii]|uniref:Transposase IS701-like DDE domain-containing protein n=1 Tax=Actinoplanes palleronii TaxID=113570 RepID=A0ABQ4B5I8_9ACTN|nr:hypothetical protein Apa02nite_020080 [Actinoplanes palleronii]
MIDRQLFLPEKWIDDPDRCRKAGVADGMTFATHEEIGEQMVARALDAGIRPLRVVTHADPGLTQCLRAAREHAGLDQYQVRDWRAWHAHVTLSMTAFAWLAAVGADSTARSI